MRRPPCLMAVAIRSIARATCGSAAFTAAETSASCALMMPAISREDFWSRFLAARLGCSVGRWLSLAGDVLGADLNRFTFPAGSGRRRLGLRVRDITGLPAIQLPRRRTWGGVA